MRTASLEQFIASNDCAMQVHCEKCRRDDPIGERWREKLTGSKQFACPPERGAKQIGFRAPPKPPVPPPAKEKRSSRFGPGRFVTLILRRLGYRGDDCGSCSAFAKKMNEAGWAKCLRAEPKGIRNEVVQWFVEKARKEGLDVNDHDVASLLVQGFLDVKGRKWR